MSAPWEEKIHPNLKKLSHSSQMLLEACPRLYELDRLSTRPEWSQDVHLDFGHVVGKIIQDFLVTGSKKESIWRAFLSYPKDIIPSDMDAEEEEKKHKKNLFYAINALERFASLKEEEFPQYKIATIDGKSAVELGFIIDCGDDFSYRGKLDGLLITSGETPHLACLETKTTGSRSLHEAMYRNSGQGIGYSAIVDVLADRLGIQRPQTFPIFYPVYQTHAMNWHFYNFTKSKNSLANWLRHILRTIQHISEYAEDDFFPMHGQSCFSYNRPCRWFETCELSNKFVVGPPEKIVLKEDKVEEYQFHFSLDELINVQIEKSKGVL